MMKMSLTGLLNRAAEQIGGGRGFDLKQLLKNLRELRERKAEGVAVLDEFFAIYVFQDEKAES